MSSTGRQVTSNNVTKFTEDRVHVHELHVLVSHLLVFLGHGGHRDGLAVHKHDDARENARASNGGPDGGGVVVTNLSDPSAGHL